MYPRWKIKTGSDEGIVVNTFEGKFDTDILLKYVKSNIYCWAIYPVIWDLSEADLSSTVTEDIITLVEEGKALSEMRKGKKTAIVAPTDLSYGLMGMFVSLAEQAGIEIEFQTFRAYKDAKKWLLQHKSPVSRPTRKRAATVASEKPL